MSTRLFMLDVPENQGIAGIAGRQPGVSVSRLGAYLAIEAPGSISIDRRATGARHAVWYSCVAGLDGCRITQWDKDALVLEAR